MELNILKAADLKSTQKRKLLLFLLQNEAKAMTAEELHALASARLPMNLSTVYRTLNTLTEKGILLKSIRKDGKAYFSLSEINHHHHLICTNCQKTIPIDICPVGELEEDLAEKTGFTITNHSLQFFGICPDCNHKKPDHTS